MDIIAKHLDRNNLRVPIIACNTICAFTGKPITEGVELKHLVGKTFTDVAYIRHDTGIASVSAAMCIAEVIPNSKGNGFNALRSYSFYASAKELRFLKREESLELLLNLPSEIPYYFVISYNSKKHTAFKARANYDTDLVYVQTDLSNEPVIVEKSLVLDYLPTIQAWYTVVAGKESSEQAPTYFTKEQILGNTPLDQQRMAQYGLEKALTENESLEIFRALPSFKLIVHLLNKTVCPA